MTDEHHAVAPPSLCDAAHGQDARPEHPSAYYFGLVAFTFFVIIVGGGLPTPFYVVYQHLWGFSPAILTVVFAAYAGGLLLTLVLFRTVSDRVGRKRVLIAGVVVGITSTAVFLTAQSVEWLIVARVLSGVSVGLTASTATAALTEFEPSGDRKRAARYVALITAVGVGIGPFYAGILLQYAPDPLTLSFWVLFVLLLGALVATLLLSEGPRLWRPTPPDRHGVFHIPPTIRSTFYLSALAAFVGFALAGIFSALAPSFLAENLHITNHAVGGATVLLMFGSAACAQLAFAGKDRLFVARLGGALVPAGLAVISVAVGTGLAPLFFGGTIVCGAGFGLCLTGGLGLLNQVAPSERRAEVLSAFYVAGYLGLSVPVVGVGLLANDYGLAPAVAIFAVIISALAVPVILGLGSAGPPRSAVPAGPSVSTGRG